MIGRLPLDEQLLALRSTLSRNDVLTEVLHRAPQLRLPGWYLTAGCLFQTVWNVVTGRPPADGIKDYDLFYFDDRDLSWEAEDAVIRAAEQVFAGLPAEVEIRNEARVHLWYEEKFGVPCTPYTSTEAAIDSFAATTCCLGVRLGPSGRWRVYAPHGLADVFNLVVRPNPVLAPREVYETKAVRWRRQWPELTVLDWPAPTGELHPPGSARSESQGR
ncbi:nucleotidyltransferase family protein [Streptomyces sp. CO7]